MIAKLPLSLTYTHILHGPYVSKTFLVFLVGGCSFTKYFSSLPTSQLTHLELVVVNSVSSDRESSAAPILTLVQARGQCTSKENGLGMGLDLVLAYGEATRVNGYGRIAFGR